MSKVEERVKEVDRVMAWQRKNRAEGREPPSHGMNGYTNYGCRCQVCRDAMSAYQRLRKTQPVTQHGYGGYTKGCKCEVCREGNRIVKKAYRERKRIERGVVVDRG